MAPKVVRSHSATGGPEEESIYGFANMRSLPPVAPKMKTYNVLPPTPTGASSVKPKVHSDSSQVRPGAQRGLALHHQCAARTRSTPYRA